MSEGEKKSRLAHIEKHGTMNELVFIEEKQLFTVRNLMFTFSGLISLAIIIYIIAS